MTKISALLATSAVGVGLAIGGGMVYFGSGHQGLQCSASNIAGGSAAIGGPFTLVDQFGTSVTEKDVIQDLTLIYFGYTYCPDVCPLDTARNLAAVDILDAQGVNVLPVFITIDPERDTPDVLADYAEVMHPRLLALTGNEEQISAASKAYKTYRRKVGDDPEDYLMDHTAFSYLMSPSGLVEFFRRDVTPEDMAKAISCHANL